MQPRCCWREARALGQTVPPATLSDYLGDDRKLPGWTTVDDEGPFEQLITHVTQANIS